MRVRHTVLGQDHARRWKHWLGSPGAEGPRPRVLVEEPGRGAAFAYWCFLDGSGYDVSWCPGPGALPPRRCALVECGDCELVRSADLVVSFLPLNSRPCREVLVALGQERPEKPVIVQAREPVLEQWRSLVEGCRTVPMPVTVMSLLDSVGDALADPGRKAPDLVGGPQPQ